MRLSAFLLCFSLATVASLYTEVRGAETLASLDHLTVAPMKTSIYIGSVKLLTGAFERRGSSFTTGYEAKVVPWFFWSESGNITITLTDAALANLARGQPVEFTGDGANQKHKPRKISGRAQPANESSGKIKVRVMADGIELIFNGTYQLGG